jgi:hypothetical protein
MCILTKKKKEENGSWKTGTTKTKRAQKGKSILQRRPPQRNEGEKKNMLLYKPNKI